MTTDSPQAAAERRTVIVLRFLGLLDLSALFAALMPTAWIAAVHAWCGLGAWPSAVIAAYLARSASVLYAVHGALILFVSFDVRRYWPLIRFLALVAVLHGAVLFAVDHAIGMPFWWRWFEGPGFAATGLLVLWAMRR